MSQEKALINELNSLNFNAFNDSFKKILEISNENMKGFAADNSGFYQQFTGFSQQFDKCMSSLADICSVMINNCMESTAFAMNCSDLMASSSIAMYNEYVNFLSTLTSTSRLDDLLSHTSKFYANSEDIYSRFQANTMQEAMNSYATSYKPLLNCCSEHFQNLCSVA
jgi:hypothetical protein